MLWICCWTCEKLTFLWESLFSLGRSWLLSFLRLFLQYSVEFLTKALAEITTQKGISDILIMMLRSAMTLKVLMSSSEIWTVFPGFSFQVVLHPDFPGSGISYLFMAKPALKTTHSFKYMSNYNCVNDLHICSLLWKSTHTFCITLPLGHNSYLQCWFVFLFLCYVSALLF